MGTKIVEKKGQDADGNEIVLKKIQLSFDGTNLNASELRIDEAGVEVATLYLVQPWKCFPDGTIGNFTSEEDAFTWAEDNLYLF